MTMSVTISFVCVLSLALNAFLFIRYRAKAQVIAYDARQLLHDLTESGEAVVHVRRISPRDIMLRQGWDRLEKA